MTRKFICLVMLVFMIASGFASCKKDTGGVEPEEDLAESVEGRYDMTYLKVKSDEDDIDTNLPFNSNSGKISGVVAVEKTGENTVTVVMTLMQDGRSIGETPFGDEVELKKQGSSVAMYISSDKIGTIKGDDLNISINDGGSELQIKAKR